MRIEQGLVSYLTNHAGLSALVSNRIYAFHAPVNVIFPFITYQRISTQRYLSQDQPVNDLVTPRFQFDIYSETYKSGLLVSDALREALQGYHGLMGEVSVQASLPALEQHIDIPDFDFFRITIDYQLSFVEEE